MYVVFLAARFGSSSQHREKTVDQYSLCEFILIKSTFVMLNSGLLWNYFVQKHIHNQWKLKKKKKTTVIKKLQLTLIFVDLESFFFKDFWGLCGYALPNVGYHFVNRDFSFVSQLHRPEKSHRNFINYHTSWPLVHAYF